MRKIGTVIMAAGASSRLGQPKQRLPFRGKTLVRTVIDAAREAGCSPVVVVIGSNAEKVQQALAHANVVKVQNKNWRCGIGSSIRAGVQALINQAPDVEAILLLVCDQPAVNAKLIERLIATREATKKNVVNSSYAGTVGVPAIFDRSFFKELLSLGDESGAKSIILRNRQHVAQFPFPEGALDIDTLDDWEALNTCDPLLSARLGMTARLSSTEKFPERFK
jgi:molybdenum cofactor cytidylyltransferase